MGGDNTHVADLLNYLNLQICAPFFWKSDRILSVENCERLLQLFDGNLLNNPTTFQRGLSSDQLTFSTVPNKSIPPQIIRAIHTSLMRIPSRQASTI
jgi:hypothetical protein